MTRALGAILCVLLCTPALATLVTPDTLKCGQDTTFYIRSDDGQDDALLDVAYIDAAAITADTLVIVEMLVGGVRDYIYWCDEGFSTEGNPGKWHYTYDSDIIVIENDPESRVRAGKSFGVPMLRDGSIIGIAMQFKVKTEGEPCDSLEASVWVNGDSTFFVRGIIDSGGAHGAWPVCYRTQPPGVDTFSAGDILVGRFIVKGCDAANAQYIHPVTRVELMYDN